MQYSFVTLLALAATGVYARAVPQPLGGLPSLPVVGDITHITDTVTKTTTDTQNQAANGQKADQDSKSSATGAQQDNKGDSSCQNENGDKGNKFCCSPKDNTNTQSNSHTTTTTDDDSTLSFVKNEQEFTQLIQQLFNIEVSKTTGFTPGGVVPRVTRRQANGGSGGDTNTQGTVTCNMQDSCSTSEKNVCFLNGNNLNVGPLGPLVFQEAPQDAASNAGTPPPPPQEQEPVERH